MNSKIIKMTACLLLIQLATTMQAQVRESILAQRADTVILREGDVNYIRTGGFSNMGGTGILSIRTAIDRVDTKDLKGKSYEFLEWAFTRDYEAFIYDLYRSVFSKERAKQLENMGIICVMRISPAENNRILHFQFSIHGSDNENFPLQLSELYALEQRLRAEPKALPPYDSWGKIVDYGAGCGMPKIRFNRLYE